MNELRSIYLEDFDRKRYLSTREVEFNKKIPPFTKTEILENLKKAFQHGYLGYHMLKDWWPIDLLKTKTREVMGELVEGLGFRYCRAHNKMIVYIDPFKIGELPKQYSWEEKGEKFADFCFDADDGAIKE